MQGRRLQPPKAQKSVPSVARWLCDRAAATLPSCGSSPKALKPVVNLLGASAGARGRKVHCGRLHRILPLAKEEETFEDFEELESFMEATLDSELPHASATRGGQILDQFAHGAIIGPGSVFSHTTASAIPVGLHPFTDEQQAVDADDEHEPAFDLPFAGDKAQGRRIHFFRVSRWQPEISCVISARSALSPPSARQTWSGPWINRLPDRKWHLRQASVSASLANTAYLGREVVNWEQLDHVREGAQASASHGRRTLSSSTEYLYFPGWGLDDDYASTLFRQIKLSNLRHINLTDNRLTDCWINFLLEVAEDQPPVALQSLHLAKNRLGHMGGMALANLLEGTKSCCLQQLDVAENDLGDVSVVKLCNALRRACKTSLIGLRLAKNSLGTSKTLGMAIGSLIANAANIQALDLHWNKIQGADATHIFKGFRNNSLRLKGQLSRVNLAWNCIGLRCREDAMLCQCDLCSNCSSAVQALAGVFSDCETLFHLDLSYNCLSAGDCATLAEGLSSNRSLYGLHMTGNAAFVDDIGLLWPRLVSESSKLQDLVQRERTRRCLDDCVRNMPRNLSVDRMGRFAEELKLVYEPVSPSLRRVEKADAFSEGDLSWEKAWLGVHAKVQSAPAFVQESEEVSANERCCWICENWVMQEVCYIPGWSGSEKVLDDNLNIFVYFSVDNFTRPTRLSKTLQRYYPRDFDLTCWHSSPAGNRHVKKALEAALDPEEDRQPFVVDGNVVCFCGVRMLPPSYDRIQVIFQVNDAAVSADHLAKVTLTDAVHLSLHCDGRTNIKEPLPAIPTLLDLPPVEVREANVIDVERQARALFEQGDMDALCLSEDLRLRAAPVPPRSLQQSHKKPEWSFKKSIFKDYHGDSDATVRACFEHDYALTRLDRFWKKHLKGEERRAELSKVEAFLSSVYSGIIAAYNATSIMDCSSSRQSCSLSLAAFSQMLISQPSDDRTPEVSTPRARRTTTPSDGMTKTRSRSKQASGEILKMRMTITASLDDAHPVNRGLPFAKADALYTAVLVDLDHLNLATLSGLPSDGLARFQFLEVLVCCAMACANGLPPLQALRSFLSCLDLGKQELVARRELHESLFTEDSCQILRRSMKSLQEVYHIYQKRLRITTGVEASMMSYSAWLLFLQDCKIPYLASEDYRMAFVLGKELCPDQHTNLRHMALSWSEFLVAVAAAVQLSGPFPAAELADRLLDFLVDDLPEAVRCGRAAEFAEAGEVAASLGSSDAKEVQLVALVSRAFHEADEDGSGLLSVREFSEALHQPRTQTSLEELGVLVGDVKLLFLRLDADDSGSISLKEFVDGLLRLRGEMQLLEKGVREMRKAFFKIETKSGSKTGITKEQFLEYIRIPANADALKGAGIQVGDINDLWQAAQQAFSRDAQAVDLSAEALVAGYLDLNLEKGRIIRAMNFLNSLLSRITAAYC
ncbi:Nlrc3 [Symbiodinium pilosum]|uniref:Nlrc3 protein n=1 Tax=Symbiodinium pilosum TaxID=2952 RepID=A0A812PA01_SYMPI|nr:Nlrc3 [Symbiodinium pilosum]